MAEVPPYPQGARGAYGFRRRPGRFHHRRRSAEALTIAGEQEIVRLAQQQADDIRDRAQQYERETRYAAEDYAEQVFTHLEENLKSLTGTVTRCRQQLNEGAAQQNGQW